MKPVMQQVILEDLITGIQHPLERHKIYTIGRSPNCDIVTLNPEDPNPNYDERKREKSRRVSGIHAEISYENEGVYIWDKKSRNGTYLLKQDEEELEEIFNKTLVPFNSQIYVSKSYPFLLRKPRDIKNQEAKQKKAASGTTDIDINIEEITS